MSEPRVLRKSSILSNAWVEVVRTDVLMDGQEFDYYALRLPDYVAVLARDPAGRILLVRQFRPAVEQFVWELPAGTLEVGETPEACCRRELLEETGYSAKTVEYLGAFWPDTGRLSNRQHLFLVECEGPVADFCPEPGLEVKLVNPQELEALVNGGQFAHLLHLSALYLGKVLPLSL